MEKCKQCRKSTEFYNFDMDVETVCSEFGCCLEENKQKLCGGKYKEDEL